MSRCEQQVDVNGNWYYPGDCGELRDQNAKMLAMLERLEWCCEGQSFYDNCPVCFSNKHLGHDGDCELAALIKEAKGADQ